MSAVVVAVAVVAVVAVAVVVVVEYTLNSKYVTLVIESRFHDRDIRL
jgi:hypothetical protein